MVFEVFHFATPPVGYDLLSHEWSNPSIRKEKKRKVMNKILYNKSREVEA